MSPTSGNMVCAWIAYVFKVVRVRVYTAGRRSASRFIFFNDDHEDLPLKPKRDTGCLDAGSPEERGNGIPVEDVQQAMPDGLSESTKVMQENVGLLSIFILMRSAQVTAVEGRKIGVRVKDCNDQAPLRMEYAV